MCTVFSNFAHEQCMVIVCFIIFFYAGTSVHVFFMVQLHSRFPSQQWMTYRPLFDNFIRVIRPSVADIARAAGRHCFYSTTKEIQGLDLGLEKSIAGVKSRGKRRLWIAFSKSYEILRKLTFMNSSSGYHLIWPPHRNVFGHAVSATNPTSAPSLLFPTTPFPSTPSLAIFFSCHIFSGHSFTGPRFLRHILSGYAPRLLFRRLGRRLRPASTNYKLQIRLLR